jgi:exonuclease SbcC
MRILKLRFENLNSLAGKWEIDFTKPEYTDNGIFVITGPTGSGKTTILDALCLALYGETPRLANINKASNEIMARQTGQCFAEAEFQIDGKQYRSTWSQRRERKKATGTLQNHSREISEVASGNILASTITEVNRKIEEITGMDFKQFTKTMLLAQGSFAAFLNSGAGDRAPILEQITGTEIYSTISKRVFSRQKDEKNALELLEAEADGIQLLNADEIEFLNLEITRLDAQGKQLAKESVGLKTLLDWMDQITGLEVELATIETAESLLAEELIAFMPSRQRLEKAMKALIIEGEYNNLDNSRKSLRECIDEKTTLEGNVRQLNQDVATAAENEYLCDRAVNSARSIRDAMQPIIACIRLKDQEIDHAKNEIANLRTSLTSEEQDFRTESVNNDRLHKKMTGLLRELNEVRSFAVESLPGLRQVSQRLKRHIKQTNDQIAGLLGGKSLIQMKLDQRALFVERRRLEKVAGFDEERRSLEDNIPCPLCGSLKHPYASGNIPAPDAIVAKLDEITGIIEEIELLGAANSKAEQADALIIDHIRTLKGILLNPVPDTQPVDFNDNELKEVQQAAAKWLKCIDLAWPDADKILSEARSIGIKTSEYLEKTPVISASINQTAGPLGASDRQLATLKETVEKSLGSIRILEKELVTLTTERFNTFGDKNPETEEKLLNTTMDSAATALTVAGNAGVQAREARTHAINRIEELSNLSLQRTNSCDVLEASFISSLLNAKFRSEQEFLTCRLPEENRTELETIRKNLDERKAKTDLRKSDRLARLKAEHEKNLTEESRETIEALNRTKAKEVTKVNEDTGAAKQKLESNIEDRQRRQELQFRLDAREAELLRWSKLNDLIGSENGAKFRNIVQGITFEILIGHANREMRRLTDRYVLKPLGEAALEMNIIDNYQAGEERSTKNLSGGESFIVSLALALGLAQMNGNRVHVDSLFLDEGFGTLDPEALEVALEALAELRRDGKLIGMISHVQEVKERIGTRITVNPLTGGRSMIEGPGVRAIPAVR